MSDGDGDRMTRKRPRDPPFVEDYRPYTGRQLARVLEGRATHKHHWDLYYRNNTVNGYRDRHYIIREFHELREALDGLKQAVAAPLHDVVWMEAGCGVGNALLPILEDYDDTVGWRIVGFDISSVAIALLQEKRAALPAQQQRKLSVQVLDPVEEDIPIAGASSVCRRPLAKEPVDFVSMIFVLCSIPVEHHLLVLRRVAACMKEGGIFFFRDYCVTDHAERRFSSNRLVEENTFARTNGTLSHFFTATEVRRLFEAAELDVVELSVVEREVLNRKEGVNLQRRFLQGRFRKAKRRGEDKDDVVADASAMIRVNT
ncbi:methyltransferase like 6 [Trypanosoma grayi]|uniref:methyltransferase like 6 n=1 Tax=Trypanosoma grayi TaxID=71804 RepID=UPI0004F3F58D|nr:methyltransferase like 6 [Trypanosoma grayi]KEG15040.1 methyltransferase like 6 [Trypanosoma grayi]